MYLDSKLKEVVGEPALRALEARAEPFTLESLIVWLETKDPRARYDYCCIDGGCLVGLYAAAHGFGSSTFMNQYALLCERVGRDAHRKIAACGPHTFGAALERARAFQATERSGS